MKKKILLILIFLLPIIAYAKEYKVIKTESLATFEEVNKTYNQPTDMGDDLLYNVGNSLIKISKTKGILSQDFDSEAYYFSYIFVGNNGISPIYNNQDKILVSYNLNGKFYLCLLNMNLEIIKQQSYQEVVDEKGYYRYGLVLSFTNGEMALLDANTLELKIRTAHDGIRLADKEDIIFEYELDEEYFSITKDYEIVPLDNNELYYTYYYDNGNMELFYNSFTNIVHFSDRNIINLDYLIRNRKTYVLEEADSDKGYSDFYLHLIDKNNGLVKSQKINLDSKLNLEYQYKSLYDFNGIYLVLSDEYKTGPIFKVNDDLSITQVTQIQNEYYSSQKIELDNLDDFDDAFYDVYVGYPNAIISAIYEVNDNVIVPFVSIETLDGIKYRLSYYVNIYDKNGEKLKSTMLKSSTSQTIVNMSEFMVPSIKTDKYIILPTYSSDNTVFFIDYNGEVVQTITNNELDIYEEALPVNIVGDDNGIIIHYLNSETKYILKSSESPFTSNISDGTPKIRLTSTFAYIEQPYDCEIKTIKGLGSAKISKNELFTGDEKEITYLPENGYYLKSVKILDKKNREIPITNNKFIMPSSNVTIVLEYDDTINPNTVDYIIGSFLIALLSFIGYVILKNKKQMIK